MWGGSRGEVAGWGGKETSLGRPRRQTVKLGADSASETRLGEHPSEGLNLPISKMESAPSGGHSPSSLALLRSSPILVARVGLGGHENRWASTRKKPGSHPTPLHHLRLSLYTEEQREVPMGR